MMWHINYIVSYFINSFLGSLLIPQNSHTFSGPPLCRVIYRHTLCQTPSNSASGVNKWWLLYKTLDTVPGFKTSVYPGFSNDRNYFHYRTLVMLSAKARVLEISFISSQIYIYCILSAGRIVLLLMKEDCILLLDPCKSASDVILEITNKPRV